MEVSLSGPTLNLSSAVVVHRGNVVVLPDGTADARLLQVPPTTLVRFLYARRIMKL